LKHNRHFEDPSSKRYQGLIKLTFNEPHGHAVGQV